MSWIVRQVAVLGSANFLPPPLAVDSNKPSIEAGAPLEERAMTMRSMRRLVVSTAVALTAAATTASAEVTQIRAAQQYGTSYLALMLMEDGKLVEKHAK